MSVVRTGILGYGVIGRRVADAIQRQTDMQLVGVASRPDSFSLRDAQDCGLPLYLTHPAQPDDIAQRLAGVAGSLSDLIPQIDVLLDCTPSGVPASFCRMVADHPNLVTIVQGGEPSPEGGVSFNAFANYRQAIGQTRIRVISCSSTGITRLLVPLDRAFGIRRAYVALARRSNDPAKISKAPMNSLRPTMGPSHHAADVGTVAPGLDLFTTSVDCPTTHSHVLDAQIDLEHDVSTEQVLERLDGWPRIRIGQAGSTADLAQQEPFRRRLRGDRPEIYVWESGVQKRASRLYISFSVHMESITIPETVDCIRAATGLCPEAGQSILKTDRSLGIEKDTACYRPELFQ